MTENNFMGTPEAKKAFQKLFFAREAKTPIPNYPFPTELDKQIPIPLRRKKYTDFCKWESNYLKKLEYRINLANKIVISKADVGFICKANPEGKVFLSNLLLMNFDKNIINELFEKKESSETTSQDIVKTVWEAVKKHVLTKKEELRIYSQS